MRVFFALWPDRQAGLALARLAREVADHAQGRGVREANLHLTLAFIGAVPESRLETLLEIGRRAAQRAAPFQLTLDRVGGRSYGLAWLAPPSPVESLQALHGTLRGELEAAGFSLQQRMFRPHITLARDCARAAHGGRVAPIAWGIERLALVASTPAAGGSEYRNVADWPLSAPQSTGIV